MCPSVGRVMVRHTVHHLIVGRGLCFTVSKRPIAECQHKRLLRAIGIMDCCEAGGGSVDGSPGKGQGSCVICGIDRQGLSVGQIIIQIAGVACGPLENGSSRTPEERVITGIAALGLERSGRIARTQAVKIGSFGITVVAGTGIVLVAQRCHGSEGEDMQPVCTRGSRGQRYAFKGFACCQGDAGDEQRDAHSLAMWTVAIGHRRHQCIT